MVTYEINLLNKSNWGIQKNDDKFVFQSTDAALQEDGKKIIFNTEDIRRSDSQLFVYTCSSDNNWQMKDHVQKVDTGIFKIIRTWMNSSDKERDVQFLFEGKANYDPSFYMIPCVSYNGNKEGKGGEPKGLTRNGKPWIFPYDRTGLASATFSEDGDDSVGVFIFTSNMKSLKSSCSMEKGKDGFYHRLYWPDFESPESYSEKDKYSPEVKNSITVAPSETVNLTFYVTATQVTIPNMGWTRAYDFVGEKLERPEIDDYNKYWDDSISFVSNELYCDINDNGLTNIGLLPEGNHNVKAGPQKRWKHRTHGRFEIGWCGQNIALANALLQNDLNSCNKRTFNQACNILESWTKYANLKTPLFSAHKFNDKGKLELWKKTVDTCNLGWGAWQMLECYEKLEAIGPGPVIDDQRLLYELPIRVCNFFKYIYNNEKKLFGKVWKLDGKCVDGDGTIGIFILLAMTKAYEVSKNREYLDCAINSYKDYCEKYLDKMICTAGALDTNCVDKETCWPFLKVGLDLYKLTKDNYFLVQAEKAAYYLLTWMFHYNVPVGENSDFVKYGYKTLGATSVSVQHHHLDPWGALICYDYWRLGVALGNSLWVKRGDILWENATRCISDGNYEVHGMVRPRGSQNEAYFQSRWGFDGDWMGSVGTMNDWLVAWPCAFRLITMMRTD